MINDTLVAPLKVGNIEYEVQHFKKFKKKKNRKTTSGEAGQMDEKSFHLPIPMLTFIRVVQWRLVNKLYAYFLKKRRAIKKKRRKKKK